VTRPALVLAALATVAGCMAELDAPAPPTSLDEAYFRCRVQPVLTKSCSAFLCHGDPERYFRVYARNRLRLGGTEATRNRALDPAERAFNFASASGFVDGASPATSLLLMKPLDENGGGYYHGGATEFGQGDVFSTRNEPEFKVLAAWINGEKEDPSCVEPGSDL
jgi:hypothetical protein